MDHNVYLKRSQLYYFFALNINLEIVKYFKIYIYNFIFVLNVVSTNKNEFSISTQECSKIICFDNS